MNIINKKLLVMFSLLLTTTSGYAAYEEVDCSTNPIFEENSCTGTDQCFLGGEKLQGDNLGLLSDLWKNVTDVSKIIYKEEQVDPVMINLDETSVTWKEVPNSQDFWEYTDEFNNLYSSEEDGYILESGKSVNWIQSSLSHAYNLEKNTAVSGSNIGLLVYFITSHDILSSGEITEEGSEHKECVLFTSGEAAPEEEIIEQPKQLPQTGPAQFVLLMLLAMLIGVGIMKFRTRM